jgi:hypothetical protein
MKRKSTSIPYENLLNEFETEALGETPVKPTT